MNLFKVKTRGGGRRPHGGRPSSTANNRQLCSNRGRGGPQLQPEMQDRAVIQPQPIPPVPQGRGGPQLQLELQDEVVLQPPPIPRVPQGRGGPQLQPELQDDADLQPQPRLPVPQGRGGPQLQPELQDGTDLQPQPILPVPQGRGGPQLQLELQDGADLQPQPRLPVPQGRGGPQLRPVLPVTSHSIDNNRTSGPGYFPKPSNRMIKSVRQMQKNNARQQNLMNRFEKFLDSQNIPDTSSSMKTDKPTAVLSAATDSQPTSTSSQPANTSLLPVTQQPLVQQPQSMTSTVAPQNICYWPPAPQHCFYHPQPPPPPYIASMQPCQYNYPNHFYPQYPPAPNYPFPFNYMPAPIYPPSTQYQPPPYYPPR